METNGHSTISCSFLGRFFGKFSHILLTKNAITCFKKDIMVKSISLENMHSFATLKKGIFGNTITLSINGKKILIPWLNNNGID